MAAKKKDKTPKKTKPKSPAGLDAETKREIEKTIRDTWSELAAEMIGLPGGEAQPVLMPQPTPCDDRFTLLEPIMAYGRSKAVAEASLATQSRRRAASSAAKLQCSSKSCTSTAEACVLDYGHFVIDTKKKAFTTKRGNEVTIWFSHGIHIAGCFCAL